jgi:hypothetical protein
MKGSALERFAQEARLQLQKEVKARLNLIQKGDASIDLIENRNAVNALNRHLEELKGDEDALVEEVAYTWFNRISALRFMDASGYNATLIVSPAEGKTLPEILSEALSGIIDEDVVRSTKDQERIRALVDGSITSKNPQAEIYRILLVASCNHLNSSLPLLFEKIEDYTDLLLPDDLLSSESIITKTVNAISKDDTESVEIIGWLYQYYISEKKDEVFASFKKGKKAGKDEIPAATQLFTPEWIVRYLVENSLGRLWMLNHPESNLKNRMKYYIDPTDMETDFIRLESPEKIKVLDPCCGSGHMLTYAFDLLFDIYTECGYTDNDAVKHIIEDNLYGIEIDKRAGQLAYFALMMKARERSRRILRKGIKPNICILQKVEFDKEELPNVINLFENPPLTIMDLMKDFENADILGSLITPSISNIAFLKSTLKENPNSSDMFSDENTLRERVKTVLDQAEYLAGKYSIVITNPPYLAPSSSDPVLQNFAKGQYPNSKTDTGTMFIERNLKFIPKNGYVAMITLQSWMFLSSFEKLRDEIINNRSILSMIHIGARGFDTIGGEVVSTTAYILSGEKGATGVKGQYVRLVDGQSEEEKSKALSVAIPNHDCGYYFEVSADQFEKIPGSPVAYWVSETIQDIFHKNKKIDDIANPRQGLATGNNEHYLRFWVEVVFSDFIFNCDSLQQFFSTGAKYVPYNKGGAFRKWYGNIENVIRFDKANYDILQTVGNHLPSKEFYFKECITWSKVTSGGFSMRYVPKGSVFDVAGCSIFSDSSLKYLLGLSNSVLMQYLMNILSQTMNYEVGNVKSIPIIFDSNMNELVERTVNQCIFYSRNDWDSFETSWDFSIHSLLDKKIIETDGFAFEDDQELQEYLGNDEYNKIFHSGIDGSRTAWSPIEFAYLRYKDWANKAFFHLKKNEEELNRIFIDIYGLQDELTPEEDDSMVSVHRIFDSKAEIPESMKKGQYALTKEDVIKSFISYVVGCMFGRYDASRLGLAFAGGDFDISSYSEFVPDADNVIPVLGDSWFKNDAETYFIKFVEKVFGHDSLNENLKFIENALGKSIREYFYKDFYKDHLKTYQKRPIYWMFSSPKGYFQALVYMHRYNENTANIVLDYLRKFREKIQFQIKLADEAGETKKKVEYENIDKDLNDYEVNILFPLAIKHLTFDLDDGVKVNYQKLGNALKPIK